jgi:dTDP-glucose pyrophosphorylase
MKAVILAAGKGTRMRELTQEVPKPMLEVKGKPILQHILEGIRSAGVLEFCIITGWRAEVIEEHFGDGSSFGVSISYVRQEVQDGTGKAPELAKDVVGNSPFILTYGDILVQSDTYCAMVERFNRKDCDGIITVTPGEEVKKGGINLFNADFNLIRVVEKPSDEQLSELKRDGLIKDGEPVWYNAGVYLFTPTLFSHTARLQKSPRGEYELTDAINSIIEAEEKLAGVKVVGDWADVRDPEILNELA